MPKNSSNPHRISDGIANMPRQLSTREKQADILFVNIQFLSHFLFVFAGLFGYYLYRFYGAIAGVIIGIAIGSLIRHSMGIRGNNPTEGYFIRMRERAQGSRRGALEWLLEKIRGNEFTQEKCRAITDAYDDALAELKYCSSQQERWKIITKLDERVKSISYD